MAERAIKILNVNDDLAARYVLTRMLRRAGVEVLEAGTGREALALMAEGPALVVLDVKLPDVSGFEICRRIKSDPRTSSIPVLHVSASLTRSENKAEGLEGGADGYLVQPVEEGELIATVHALLRMRRAEAEAGRLSRHWQTTFDALSDAVCLLDPAGRLVQGNRAFQALFAGGAPLPGQGFEELLRSLGGAAPRERGSLDAPEASGVFELRLGERWFRVSADPVGDEHGRSTGGVRVLADLTDRRRLEEELRARADELARADKRKDEFLAMLAHELRNPLAAISAGIQVMDRLAPVDGRAGKMRDMVRRQSKHLARLVDDLLDVSRISRGKIELRRNRVDLVGVVRQALQSVRALVEERRHAVELALPEDGVWLEADATRLEQVVTNLLDNAAKYTEPEGTLRVEVRREEGPGGRWAELRVRDTGVGIPAELLGPIFEPFAQAQQTLARSRGGLGLGLTLVRELVRLHGGKVTATSPGAGKGSEFVIRFPACPPQPAGAAGAAPSAPAPAPRSPALGRRVLLVEDNVDAREALRDLLADWGHQVEVAADGPTGLAQVLSLRPDVALVDIGLPGLDGYQVARQVRAAPGGRGLYLIALTGYGDSQQRLQALEAGFDLHLVKPVEPDDLARALKELPARPPGDLPPPVDQGAARA